MLDPRMTRLADTLVNYSCAVKPDEKILIEAIDVPPEFTAECVRVARAAGASPPRIACANVESSAAISRLRAKLTWHKGDLLDLVR